MNERLLYNGTAKNRELPRILEKDDISRILLKIQECPDYFKKGNLKDWGEFMKMRDITLIATIYILSLRPKEACCLKFSDFDFKHSYVVISPHSNKVKKSRRIPVPKVLYKYFFEYFKFPRERFWKNSEYLFPSLMSNHISPKRIECVLREKALKPLGLWKSGRISTYSLRHSRASHILAKQIEKNGVPDLYGIASILGHADIRSTTVYLHTDEKYQDYVRDLMEI